MSKPSKPKPSLGVRIVNVPGVLARAGIMEAAAEQGQDEAREVWAKVLAGELARPGSVSTATLQVLRQLSKDDAIRFLRMARLAHKFGAILIPGGLDGSKFLNLHEIMALGSARLMHVKPSIGTVAATRVGDDPAFRFRRFSAVVDKNVGTIQSYWMTTAGVELLDIVDAPPLAEYIRFPTQHIPITRFHRVLSEEGGVVYYGPELTMDGLLESFGMDLRT